jgi:hypothetical protein
MHGAEGGTHLGVPPKLLDLVLVVVAEPFASSVRVQPLAPLMTGRTTNTKSPLGASSCGIATITLPPWPGCRSASDLRAASISRASQAAGSEVRAFSHQRDSSRLGIMALLVFRKSPPAARECAPLRRSLHIYRGLNGRKAHL